MNTKTKQNNANNEIYIKLNSNTKTKQTIEGGKTTKAKRRKQKKFSYYKKKNQHI